MRSRCDVRCTASGAFCVAAAFNVPGAASAAATNVSGAAGAADGARHS